MTHIETARYNEVIGLQIGAIQKTVMKLDENKDLEDMEAIVDDLEKELADLKSSLSVVPHKHR